jgi:DNA transformation protein and related proteins
MAVSASFSEMLIELLSPLGPVRIRRMFGGGGVYLDGLMFGLIFDDVLHFKADARTQKMFEDEGMGPFVYDAKGRPIVMSFWQAPERLYDEPDDLVAFARAAVDVAKRAAAARVNPNAPSPQPGTQPGKRPGKASKATTSGNSAQSGRRR